MLEQVAQSTQAEHRSGLVALGIFKSRDQILQPVSASIRSLEHLSALGVVNKNSV